jgi:hypothetical protein
MFLHGVSSLKFTNLPFLRIVLHPETQLPETPVIHMLTVDVHDIYVDGQHIVLSLWDTAGLILVFERC